MRGLEDAEVQVDGDVEFRCELSRAGATEVEWRLQGLPLQNNEVTELAVQGGCTHTLRLKGVTPEDAGTVSFHVGAHTSSAQLTVRGSGCHTGSSPQYARDNSLGPWPSGLWDWWGGSPVRGWRWQRTDGGVPHVLVLRKWGGVLGGTPDILDTEAHTLYPLCSPRGEHPGAPAGRAAQ